MESTCVEDLVREPSAVVRRCAARPRLGRADMIRGTFANIRLHSQLAPGTEGGWTRDFARPEPLVVTIHDAAVHYATARARRVPRGGRRARAAPERSTPARVGTALLDQVRHPPVRASLRGEGPEARPGGPARTARSSLFSGEGPADAPASSARAGRLPSAASAGDEPETTTEARSQTFNTAFRSRSMTRPRTSPWYVR